MVTPSAFRQNPSLEKKRPGYETSVEPLFEWVDVDVWRTLRQNCDVFYFAWLHFNADCVFWLCASSLYSSASIDTPSMSVI